MKFFAEVIPNSNVDTIRDLDMLISEFGVPARPLDLGLEEEDVDKAAEIVVSKPFWNPRRSRKSQLHYELKALARARPRFQSYSICLWNFTKDA